eukprot:5406277-Pleurochrysis_carterae.AAC.1
MSDQLGVQHAWAEFGVAGDSLEVENRPRISLPQVLKRLGCLRRPASASRVCCAQLLLAAPRPML